MTDQFDAWLTKELDRGLRAERPRARFAPGRGSRRLTLKAAAIAVAAVLLTGGVAMAAGTAVTGTPNPAVWGQQVQAHVQDCKNQLAAGHHGIGECVSAFAKQHGRQQQGTHGNSKDGTHGQGHGQGNGHGHGHGAAGTHTPEPGESPEPPESPEPSESPGT